MLSSYHIYMKILLTICCSLLIVLIGWLSWNWLQRPIIQPIGPNDPIVFFGDSLVYGIGAEKGNDMPSLLSASLDRAVINSGTPGDTTADGLAKLDDKVLQFQPALVLILLGGNDVLQNISEEDTFQNLSSMIDRIQATNAQVILIGVRGGLLYDSYGDNYAKLARQKRVVHVDDILAGIFTDPALKADQVHPNDAGYAKMAERLLPIVRQYIVE